jgi:hypothetical protein
MKHPRPELSFKSFPDAHEIPAEAALLEEVRQLRAALKIYRELVEKLLSERQDRN